MPIRDCLISAAAQGAITREEAQTLVDLFDENFAQQRLAMGDAPALSASKDLLEKILRSEALEKRRKADLTEAARLTLKQRFIDNKDGIGTYRTAESVLSHYGFRDGSSVRGRAEAIMATAHAAMGDFMFTFRRSGLLGKRENRALHTDFVKELHGEHSGDATAKALANGVGKTFEDLRQRFNAAGGSIGKLENWGMPHTYDRLKVKAMGPDAFKARMLARLNPAGMKDNLTGAVITPPRLDAAISHAYENIVSEGRAHMTPQMRGAGLGAISSRRQDERFFVFRDATAWLEHHREFGRGDVVQAVVNHVNSMSKDIAAMELLGPNPAAMVEWMKQVVARDIGRLEAGLPSQSKKSRLLPNSQARASQNHIGWLWEALRGNGTVVSGFANFTDNTKNLTNAAILGATGILAGGTDPFIAASARRLANIPMMQNAGEMLKNLSRQNRDEIVRSGVIWDEYLHVMGDDLRFAGPALGAEWTRWLADRAVTWNGLKPLTTGRKLVEARAWQGHIADLAREGKDFGHLDQRFKRALDGFGVTREHWDIWRGAIDGNGFVTPMEIISRGGSVQYLDLKLGALSDAQQLAEVKALAHREAAEKLAELTTSWSERSVPGGTPNARSLVSAGGQRGTIPREFMEYFMQLKGFGLSFTTLQMEAMAEMASAKGGGKGVRTGLGHFAALAIPLTLGGGVYIQIKALLDGKDPEDMNPFTNPTFWGRALVTGGSFGLFGDFLKASENRFGQSVLEAVAGPSIAFLSDAIITTVSQAWDIAAAPFSQEADPFEASRRRRGQMLDRWTPIASSHPLTRAAYRRVLLDNLQWATDPNADKAFKAKISRAKSNGSQYFLPPGTLTPSRKIPPRRAPNWRSAIGQ
jgi:hypothetical protein